MRGFFPLSESRKPQGIVTINDQIVNWTEIVITTETYYTADNYMIELPLSGQSIPFSLDYWASSPIFTVKIYLGIPENPLIYGINDLELMMVGDCDDIDIDIVTGKITITGRDLTSRLIDTKTTQKFSSLTSSAIATKFANEHNLNPVVTPTKTQVGVYYNFYQTILTRQTTEWDVLTFLAQQENFIVYVSGNDLVFKPLPSESDVPYVITYTPRSFEIFPQQLTALDIQFHRSMTLANDVVVKLRVPFGSKTGKAFTVKVQSHHQQRAHIPGIPTITGRKQLYTYVIPGLTQEQALQRAQSILKNITIHEVKLNAVLPGDNFLRKDSVIKVVGTNSAFDQIYYCDMVRRTLSMEEGYSMILEAKNHSVDSQVIL